MALAFDICRDIMHGRGPNSKRVSPGITKEVYVLAADIAANGVLCAVRTLLIRQSMVLAVDMIHRRDPSNEMHPQLQPEKTEIWLGLLLI